MVILGYEMGNDLEAIVACFTILSKHFVEQMRRRTSKELGI